MRAIGWQAYYWNSSLTLLLNLLSQVSVEALTFSRLYRSENTGSLENRYFRCATFFFRRRYGNDRPPVCKKKLTILYMTCRTKNLRLVQLKIGWMH